MGVVGRMLEFWLNGIRDTLPDWTLLPGARRRWVTIIELHQLPADIRAIDSKLSAVTRSRPIEIALSPACFLQRVVALPQTGRRRKDSILDLNLRQVMPVGSGTLLWRAFPKAGARSGTQYMQLVVKKEHLDALVKAVERHGLTVRRVTIAGHPGLEPLVDNRRHTDRPIRVWWGLAGFACLAGLLIWAGGLWVDIRARMDVLEARRMQVAVLREDVIAATQEGERISSFFHEASEAVDVFNAQAAPLRMLADLTRVLGDNVWISELTLSGATLLLAGFTSADIADVLETLRALPWVAGVSLDAPVSVDRLSLQSRFDLSIAMGASG